MDNIHEVIRLFEFYKSLGEKAINQVPDELLSWQYTEESNSIGVIVQHLHGNMLSRWTNFLEEDGEKEWRNRDGEFLPIQISRVELMELWESGWKVLFDTLKSLKPDDLTKKVYIRNHESGVFDAILRQLAHYSYHIGQIVFLAKMTCKTDWQSLSIPKNQSQIYNQDKFSQEQSKTHFTSEFVKPNLKDK
jgi:hypothetical protein